MAVVEQMTHQDEKKVELQPVFGVGFADSARQPTVLGWVVSSIQKCCVLKICGSGTMFVAVGVAKGCFLQCHFLAQL